MERINSCTPLNLWCRKKLTVLLTMNWGKIQILSGCMRCGFCKVWQRMVGKMAFLWTFYESFMNLLWTFFYVKHLKNCRKEELWHFGAKNHLRKLAKGEFPLFPASRHDGAGKLSRRSVKTFMTKRENFHEPAWRQSRTNVAAAIEVGSKFSGWQ